MIILKFGFGCQAWTFWVDHAQQVSKTRNIFFSLLLLFGFFNGTSINHKWNYFAIHTCSLSLFNSSWILAWTAIFLASSICFSRSSSSLWYSLIFSCSILSCFSLLSLSFSSFSILFCSSNSFCFSSCFDLSSSSCFFFWASWKKTKGTYYNNVLPLACSRLEAVEV